jgi:aldehyde:ferredoxin oxidoreductase
MNQAKSYYYTLMGWDPKSGVPLPEKLAELGLSGF